MSNQNIKLDSGYVTITFTDLEDHTFSRFRLNPTDVKFAKRFEETVPYFDSLKDKHPETLSEIDAISDEIGDKISYVLGYDSKSEVFGEVPAFTIVEDGSYFIEHVLDKIYEVAKPAIAKRREAMAKTAEKYTAKYESV